MSKNLKSDYCLCEEIGRGKYAVVYRCYSLVSGKVFACKSIDKRSFNNVDHLIKEPKIYQYLSKHSHPNVLRMHGVYEDDYHIHIILDFCDSGNLDDRIFNKNPLSESQARVYFRDLMRAVAWCHDLGIVHRDIKPNNVLINSTNTLKLTDFGCSDWFVVNGRERMMNKIAGTLYFIAPEVLSGKKYNEKVDIWSCGGVLYMMLTGFAPFSSNSDGETIKKILKGDLMFPKKVSSDAKDLLRKMLCKDNVMRLSADEVLSHPWVLKRDESADMYTKYSKLVARRCFDMSRDPRSL